MSNRTLVFIMALVHLKQASEWLGALLGFNNPKREFKYLAKLSQNSVDKLLKFMQSECIEEYELSAEISDNILRIVKLPEEDQQRIYDFIEVLERENRLHIVAK